MNSNIGVRSNLMLDDEQHKPQHRYLPGDFVAVVYPNLTDSRVYASQLTQRQIIEMRQHLVCMRCGRPCAGTCGR